MHFYMRLIQNFPVFFILGAGGGFVPPGFDRVITKRGTFVVTGRNSNVIAKAY